MHSEETNLAKLIISANGMIVSNCKSFLSEMTSNPKLYREYLHNLSFNGNPMSFFLKKAASIKPENFYDSYKEFSSYFPNINLFLESSPKRGNGTQYFTELLKVDWYSDLIKIALCYFIQKILSQFLNEMIYLNETISADEIKKVILLIFEFIKKLEPPTNDYEESLALETMDLWSFTIYLLSSINSEIVWSIFVENVLSNSEITDFHRACFYSSFSSIVLSSKQGNNYTNHISNLIQLLSTKSSNHFYCIELTKLIHTLLFQNIKILKSSFNSSTTQLLFQILISQMDFNKEAFNLVAHISNFIDSTIFSTINQYINYYDKVNPEMRPSYIKSIVYKLYGENFATPVENSKKHINYGWYIKGSRSSQDVIINFMLNKDDTLKDYGDELSYVVEQMMISDLYYFTKVILKQMDDSQNTKTNICTSLYKGLKLFYSNITYFKELNPILNNDVKKSDNDSDDDDNDEEESECSSDILKTLEEKARLIVFGFLAKREKKKCTVYYDTSSLAASLLSAITDADEKQILNEQIRTLSDTSKPIFTEEDQINDISMYTSQFGNSYKPVELEKNPEVEEYIEDPTKSFNPDLQNVLALTVYLNPSDDIIQFVTDTLLACSPLNGSMIMRCLQALIHLKHENAALIIHHLCDYFISNQIDVVEITLIINAINLVIESAYFEKIPLSGETMSKICLIAILGFVTPDPMVHQKIFDICQTLMHSKTSIFYLQIFFDRYEKELSFDALRRAAQAIMPISDNDANFLLQPTFHQVSLSNYPTFYLFYLSALGRFIVEHNEGFEYSIKYLSKVLSEKLFSLDNQQLDSYFTNNCLALLLSIAENMDVFKMYQIKRTCLIFLRKYSSNETENAFLTDKDINNSVQLIAILSGITPSLYQAIMPLFSQASFPIARTFSFLTHEMICRGTFTCMENNRLSKSLYAVLHASLILIFRRYVDSENLFLAKSPRLSAFSSIHLFLNNFCEALEAVFRNIAEANQQNSKPLFICENNQLRTIIDHPFNTKKWFAFFCNLMSYTESMFCDNLMAAFNGWLGISQIPDKYFRTFMEKLPSLGKLYPDISTTIFKCNPSNRLPFYIIHARKHFHMFMAIANQIVVEGIPTENKVNDTITFRFGNTETIYYHNCGSLIALALFNMISKRTDRRIAGLKFLSAMVAIIGIFRNDPHSTAQIYKFIETIKPTMLNSFTVFLQRDFIALNSLLASKFKFCGEQFANECFSIVKTKEKTSQINSKALPSFPSFSQPSQGGFTKPIKLKPIAQSGAQKNESVSYMRSTSVDYQMNFALKNMNMPNINNEPISSKYSVRKSWNAIMGSNLQLLSMQKQSMKYEQINVEKPQILTSLMAEWLNPISFDLQKIGICRDCKEEYRVFGIYSFVNGLLTLCNAQGMTKPLADILDILIENNHELLELCLYDLQATSPSHAKSATLFLIYLYNKKPEDFIKFIREYLRVTAWYFYEIQVSKVDQLLDINKIMDRNSGVFTSVDMPSQPNKIQKGPRERSFSSESKNSLNCPAQQAYEVDYLQIINFTLNLVDECRKENAERFHEIRSEILIFCLIHNSTFSEIADTLISNITKLKPNVQAAGAAQAFITQNKVQETWKLSDIAPFIEGAERFLLEWGLTCGDLSAASKALQIFELKGYTLPSEAIPTMLNSMQSVSTAMHERTDPSKKNNFNQWILRIAGDGMRTNFEAVVSWLYQCLILLRRHAISNLQVQVQPFSTRTPNRRSTFNRNSKKASTFKLELNDEPKKDEDKSILPPRTEAYQKKFKLRNSTIHNQKFALKSNEMKENDSILIKTFWTAVSFLQCHSLEYSTLFISALKIVDLFMSKNQLVNLLKENKTCRIKSGLIPLLLGAKASDVYSINSIFTIISCILENDLVNLLSPKKNAACIAIIALLPWIWMRFNRQDVNTEYCSTLTNLISDQFDNEQKLAELKDALEQIGYYQSATPTAVLEAFKLLYNMIDIEDLQLILRFFIQAAKIGTVSQKECIFILCDSIYDQFNHDVPKSLSDVISLITYYAVIDTSTQNSPYVLKFLRNLAQHNEYATTPPAMPTGRTFTLFPEMEIASYYYNEYETADDKETEGNDPDYHLRYDRSKLSEWEPNSAGVFADYSLYPPLLITDPGFNGSEFLKGIKKAIDKIVTVPFNKWYDQLFKAQLQNVTTSIQIKSERFASVEVQAGEFIANFTEDMGSDNKTRPRKLTPDKRRWQAIFEDISNLENDESFDFAVLPDQFFISQAHIDSLVH